jgi:hypothetical protein
MDAPSWPPPPMRDRITHGPRHSVPRLLWVGILEHVVRGRAAMESDAMTRGSRLMAGCLAAVSLAAGCSGRAPQTEAPSPPAAVHTAGSLAAFGTGKISLDCSDSISPQPGEPVGEVPFEGLPMASAGEEPPMAQDVGLRLPPGLHWFFRKNPLSVRKGAADFTLTVSSPSQALAWVPARSWTSGSVDLTRWSAASLTLHSCPDRDALFLGGILAEDLHTCLRMTMRQAAQPERTVRQHLDGSACKAA